MKKLFASVLLATAAIAAQAATTFIIDIDDASRVKFESGQTSASYVEMPLVNGANTVTQSGSEDFVLTPRQGFLIESITAYNAAGEAQASSGWSFDPSNDSYKIYFLGSRVPAAKYVVKTKIYNPTLYTLSIDINNPEAVLNGSYKVGNQTITPQAGKQTITFNPDKGVQFYMQLRPAVKSVTFSRNGANVEPAGVMQNGTRTYKFNLSDNEVIDIDAVMETTEYFLDIDDPTHIEAFYPDANTPIEGLKAGRNTLSFSYNSTLYIKAAPGYRITGLANMSFNSNTDVYSYRFSDGDSGMVFNCTTEEYTPPTATVIVNVDDATYVNYITINGENKDCVVGENTFVQNLDKSKTVNIYYKSKWDDKLIAAMNGEPFTIVESMWYPYSSTISDMEADKTYRVVIRQKIDGSYNAAGTVVCKATDPFYSVWNISFSPAGIIEINESAGIPTITAATKADASESNPTVELTDDSATITFATPLADGDYIFSVPAGYFKVNGAPVDAISQPFNKLTVGIETIEAENANVRFFNLQGVEIKNPAEGEMIIEVRGNKSAKKIFRN